MIGDAQIFALLARMDMDRQQRYRENLAFYKGDQWLSQSEATARRRRRLTLNYARAVVDKTTAYTMSSLDYAVDPLEQTDAERARARAAESALYALRESLDLDGLDFDSELDAAILGDGAYKVTWHLTDGVVVTAPDVQGIYLWTSGHDHRRVLRLASRYELSTFETEEWAPFRSLDAGQGVDVCEVWEAATYGIWARPRGSGPAVQVDGGVNPYGWIPYVVWPNLRRPKEVWGESDIPSVVESCRELNRVMSTLSEIMEFSGAPITVLEGADPSGDQRVTPGQTWVLPEGGKAYLLDLMSGGGVRVHLDYIRAVMRSLHDLGESPRTAFGDNERNLSGVALEVELQPLLQKVKRKRLIRTVVYRRRARMILDLLTRFGGQPFAGLSARVVWGAVTPRDRSADVRDEQVLVASGIHSRRRAADELGVEDSERELERWLEEERLVATAGAVAEPAGGDGARSLSSSSSSSGGPGG